jgi:hypothetical protein
MSGVDSSVDACVGVFCLCRTQNIRVWGQLSGEDRLTTGVPQGSVLGPLLFLSYLNYIWRNFDSTFIISADECVVNKNY